MVRPFFTFFLFFLGQTVHPEREYEVFIRENY